MTSREHQLAEQIKDPVWFVRNVLGDDPWEQQAHVLRSVSQNREVNVKSCHSAGKSWLASRAVLWFLYAHPNSMVITTAPTGRQVRGILWKEIRSAYGDAKISLGGRMLQTKLELSPSWFAWGFTAPDHDPTRWQGYHADDILVVVDEACGIKETIDTAIDTILSGAGGRLLRIGNPTDEGTPFGSSFQAVSPYNLTISAFDTPNFTTFGITKADVLSGAWKDKIGDKPLPRPHLISPDWVADKAHRWGVTSPMWLSRIEAVFPTADDTTVIPLSLVQKAHQNDLSNVDGPKIMGIDVAHMGVDETVVVVRQGGQARIIDSWNKTDTMTTVGKLKVIIEREQPTATYIDGIGVGAGVYDRLKELGVDVHSVNVGLPAWDKDRFANQRAELFWTIRESIDRDELDLDPLDDVLASQLTKIRYDLTSAGKILLESKAKMGKSPDRADALSLTFAHRGNVTAQLPDFGFRSSPWTL
jgi:phage terminase large subunit